MKITKKIKTNEVARQLDWEVINDGVVSFIKTVNMMSGSAGNIDLYSFLQAYLLDEKKRMEINSVLGKR